MTHARQQIRTLVASTTLTGLAGLTGSGTIYRSRTQPVTLFPSIAVYNESERLDDETQGAVNVVKRYRRFYRFTIEIAVQVATDADNALDELCRQVETAMAADETMGGGVIATDLVTVAFARDLTGETPVHACRMTYQAEYRTTAADPETFLA